MFDWYLKKDLPENYKYKLDWLRSPDLDAKMATWMHNTAKAGFVARKFHDIHRKQIVYEFHEVLQHYAYALNSRIEKLRGRSTRRLAILNSEVSKVKRAIDRLRILFKQYFKTDFGEYLTHERLVALTENVTSFQKKVEEAEQLQEVLDAKLELVDFWLDDLRGGSESFGN